MRIEIEIPKEFEKHFAQDKFEDSLQRLGADIHLIASNYERVNRNAYCGIQREQRSLILSPEEWIARRKL